MIISITGKIGSGKDTIAEIIQQSTQLDWEVKKFAGKKKQLQNCFVEFQNKTLKVKSLRKLKCLKNGA